MAEEIERAEYERRLVGPFERAQSAVKFANAGGRIVHTERQKYAHGADLVAQRMLIAGWPKVDRHNDAQFRTNRQVDFPREIAPHCPTHHRCPQRTARASQRTPPAPNIR